MNSNIGEIAKNNIDYELLLLLLLTGYTSLIFFKLHQQTISPIFGIVMLFVGIFVFSILNKLFEIYAPTTVDINYLCRIDSIIKDIVRKYNKRKNIIQDIVENDKLIEELKREILDYLETEKSLKNISIYENDNNNFKIIKGKLEYKFTIML